MPGSVFKWRGGWAVELDHGHDETGKRLRKRVSFRKKREAEAYRGNTAVHITAVAGLGAYGSTRLRVGAYLEDWLSRIQTRVRPSTHKRYSEFVHVHLVPHLGQIQLYRLTPQAIEAFYSKLHGKISTTTARHIAVLLSQALKAAVRLGIITQNPADNAEKPKPKRWVPTLWSAEQALQFLEGARGTRHYLLYRILLETGLRLGEALALAWTDIEFTNGLLVVREGKTRNARRGLKLSQELLSDLRAVRGVGRIFHSRRTGTTLDDDTVRDYFYKLVKRLELPRVRLHDLRHLNASLMLQEGVDLATVSARLGHASKAFTLSQYTHALSAGQEKAAEVVSQLSAKSKASRLV